MDINQDQGLIDKFKVERLTPSRRNIEHDGCFYFVLDLTHDAAAGPALMAYADQIEDQYPKLAGELRQKVKEN